MKAWIKIERIPGVLASAYEKATRMVIEGYYRPVAREIVANINEGTILDLGTGPGNLPIEIAKRSLKIKVIGVDLSRKLIEIARSNASKAGLADRLTFKSGNAGRLEREAWIFDPARVASRVDREKWKASLTLPERFFLWLFKLFGLHKPIKTYTREQAIALIKQTDFKNFRIDEKEIKK
jgi:SAM-dependent methyltransferase